MELEDPGLENRLVRLEPVGDEERHVIAQSGAIKAMWDWLPALPGRGTTFEAYFEHVMARAKLGEYVPLIAYRKSDNAFVGGACYVHPNRTHRSVRIGYLWIRPEHRGSRMFAAIQAALVCRAHAWRARRIVWTVDSQNLPLSSAIGRLGITCEGVLRSCERLNAGRWSDAIVYAAVRDEIPALKSRLNAMLAIAD